MKRIHFVPSVGNSRIHHIFLSAILILRCTLSIRISIRISRYVGILTRSMLYVYCATLLRGNRAFPVLSSRELCLRIISLCSRARARTRACWNCFRSQSREMKSTSATTTADYWSRRVEFPIFFRAPSRLQKSDRPALADA